MSNSGVLAELRALRLELAELSARVLALEEARVQQTEGASSNQVTVSYSITGTPGTLQVGGIPASERDQPPVEPGLRRPPGNHRVGAAYYTDEERRLIAISAGRFIRRALDGDHRGTSGRENLRLQSRVYLLFRDHSGNLYNPVRVFDSLSSLNSLVRPRGDLGDSVFIGFPTRWEAKVCAEEASVGWPLNG